jgi:hypothetical protein
MIVENNKANFCVWFSGFVDGEGYFQIARVKSKRAKGGYLYLPMMGVGLRKDDYPTLYNVKKTLGLGCLCHGKRQGKFKNEHPSIRWVVSGVKQCLKLIDLFDAYPLRTKKKKDYVVWKNFVLQKAEHGRKLPMSVCEYHYRRIREVREYNSVLVGAYERSLGEKDPIIFKKGGLL